MFLVVSRTPILYNTKTLNQRQTYLLFQNYSLGAHLENITPPPQFFLLKATNMVENLYLYVHVLSNA